MDGDVFLVVTVLFLIILLVSVAVNGASEEMAEKTARSEDAFLSIAGFTPTGIFVSQWDRSGLAIEDETGRVALLADEKIRVFEANQILGAELIENSTSLIQTNRGSQVGGAVVGGVLFGGVGAVVGGLSGSKRSSSNVSKLKLRVTVDSFDDPICDILFFDWIGQGVERNGSVYPKHLKTAELWYARMNRVMKSCQLQRSIPTSFSLVVAHPDTGETSTLVVEATSREHAEQIAFGQGWLIQREPTARDRG